MSSAAPHKGTLSCPPAPPRLLGDTISCTHCGEPGWNEPGQLQSQPVMVYRAPGEGREEQGRVEENTPNPPSPCTPPTAHAHPNHPMHTPNSPCTRHPALRSQEEEQPALALLTVQGQDFFARANPGRKANAPAALVCQGPAFPPTPGLLGQVCRALSAWEQPPAHLAQHREPPSRRKPALGTVAWGALASPAALQRAQGGPAEPRAVAAGLRYPFPSALSSYSLSQPCEPALSCSHPGAWFPSPLARGSPGGLPIPDSARELHRPARGASPLRRPQPGFSSGGQDHGGEGSIVTPSQLGLPAMPKLVRDRAGNLLAPRLLVLGPHLPVPAQGERRNEGRAQPPDQ